METLINIILLIIGSFIAATITKFLNWCMGEPDGSTTISGRVFSFYGKWLSVKYNKFKQEKNKTGMNWTKVFGMCIYCFGVYIAWISLLVGFLIGWFHLSALNHKGLEIAFIIIFYPAVSSYFLHKINDNG